MSFIVRDFVVNKAIKKGIELAKNIKSKYRTSLAFSRRYRKLSPDEQDYIVYAILNSQSRSIKHTVESLHPEGIMIPGIGSLKFSKSRAKRIELMTRELEARGYTRINDVYDPVVRQEIIDIVQAELYAYNLEEFWKRQNEKRNAPVIAPDSIINIVRQSNEQSKDIL